jgi:hypothetical protein
MGCNWKQDRNDGLEMTRVGNEGRKKKRTRRIQREQELRHEGVMPGTMTEGTDRER